MPSAHEWSLDHALLGQFRNFISFKGGGEVSNGKQYLVHIHLTNFSW